MKKKNIISVLGILLSFLFLYLSVRGLEFRSVFYLLKTTDPRLFVLSIYFILFSNLTAAIKWSLIHENSRIKNTLPALFIGFFVNNVLPVRIGEIVRGYVISKNTHSSLTYGVSTVLFDRLFDFFALLFLAIVFFPKKALPTKILSAIETLAILFCIFIFAFLLMGRKKTESTIQNFMDRRQGGFFRGILERIVDIQRNIARLNSPFLLFSLAFLGIVQWLSMSLSLYLVTLSLGISISFLVAPFICACVNMGLIIPSSPGYVGVYEFLLIYLYTIFGISKSKAFTASILFHATWFTIYTLLGFFFLLKEQLNIREIKRFGSD